MNDSTTILVARDLLEEVRELMGADDQTLSVAWDNAGRGSAFLGGNRSLFSPCARISHSPSDCACLTQVAHGCRFGFEEFYPTPPEKTICDAVAQDRRIPCNEERLLATWEGLEPFASWQTVMGLRWGEYGPEDLVYVDLATGEEASQ